MKKIFLISLFALVFVFAFSGLVLSITPSGAGTVNVENTSTAGADNPGNNSAIAGNVTELTIAGFSTTQAWQGYFGNVTGTVQLADASDNVLYNWSNANPSGEVYASTAGSVTWSAIECFDVSGTNLSTLETAFGIGSSDVDGVNETFLTKNHEGFYTNNIQFNANDCNSVQLYDSTGASVDTHFEEVLLTADGSTTPIFTSLLEETSLNGFDSKDHDFEMVVLEDGHLTDTSTTLYYFYVELE